MSKQPFELVPPPNFVLTLIVRAVLLIIGGAIVGSSAVAFILHYAGITDNVDPGRFGFAVGGGAILGVAMAFILAWTNGLFSRAWEKRLAELQQSTPKPRAADFTIAPTEEGYQVHGKNISAVCRCRGVC